MTSTKLNKKYYILRKETFHKDCTFDLRNIKILQKLYYHFLALVGVSILRFVELRGVVFLIVYFENTLCTMLILSSLYLFAYNSLLLIFLWSAYKSVTVLGFFYDGVYVKVVVM
jgi:hypothetical protein